MRLAWDAIADGAKASDAATAMSAVANAAVARNLPIPNLLQLPPIHALTRGGGKKKAALPMRAPQRAGARGKPGDGEQKIRGVRRILVLAEISEAPCVAMKRA